MNLENVVAQLKAYAPALAGGVSGAANFASGLESTVNMPLPAAFVLALDDEAGENTLWPGLQQTVTERIGVVVEFDNTTGSDVDARTGFAGVDQVYPMRAIVYRALLSWIPPDLVGVAARGFSYGGGRILHIDRARLFWQFEFTIDRVISDADGFELYGDPIESAIGTIYPESDTTAQPIVFDIPVS